MKVFVATVVIATMLAGPAYAQMGNRADQVIE